MATNIFHIFLINGDPYTLIGMAGDDLVLPEQFKMKLSELHNTCHRGFYAMYELTQETLYLRGITPREENENYLSIKGIEPAKDSYQPDYHDPIMEIPFTGKIRLAKNFINEPYFVKSYQKAIAFKTVFDITLEDGRVVEVKNRSWEMKQKRDALRDCYKSGNKQEYYKFANKLEKVLYSFSLDTDLE